MEERRLRPAVLMENLIEIGQWSADIERLLIAGLANEDEEALSVLEERCRLRFGNFGPTYFRNLVATLPDRRPDLFPELDGFV